MAQKRRQSRYRDESRSRGSDTFQSIGNFMLGAATLTLGAGVLGSISDIFKK
jgi:hypothetical protein